MSQATTLANVLGIMGGATPYASALAGGADAQATGVELVASHNIVVPATTNIAWRLPVAPYGVIFTVYNNAATALAGKVYPPVGGTIYNSAAAGTLNAAVSQNQYVMVTYYSLGDGNFIAK